MLNTKIPASYNPVILEIWYKDDSALLALQEASEAMITARDPNFATKALEKLSAAKDLWDERVATYQKSHDESSPELKPFWERSLKNAKSVQAACSEQLIHYQGDEKNRLDLSRSGDYFIQAEAAEDVADSTLGLLQAPLDAGNSSSLDAAIEKATQAQQIWNKRIVFIKQAQAENPQRAESFSISLAYSKGQSTLWSTTVLALTAWKKAHAASEGENHTVLLTEAVGAMSIAAKSWKDSATELEENDAAPKENSRSDFFTAKAAELKQSR